MVWLTQYNFDGFRHDATKHIDELYWRTLTYRIRKQTQQPVYQIGETYGSPSLINSYISTGMLDAQFDFNLYDAAVNTFAEGKDHQHLLLVLEQGLKTYGYHHLMGNISGNQDRSRFISLASGEVKFDEDQKLAGWDREIGKPSAVAYKKLALLHAFNNAIPGVPCSYYGDEIGLPGAGDPDNRRMMYFTNWDKNEQELYEKVKELNTLRAKHLALIYGTTEYQLVNEGVLILKRKYFNEEVYVLLNATDKEQVVQMPFETLDLQVIDQQNPQAENEITDSGILLAPWGYRILSNQL
jgi:glycosidase